MPAVISQLRVATDYHGSILPPAGQSSKSCLPQALPSPPWLYYAAHSACCRSHLLRFSSPKNLARK